MWRAELLGRFYYEKYLNVYNNIQLIYTYIISKRINFFLLSYCTFVRYFDKRNHASSKKQRQSLSVTAGRKTFFLFFASPIKFIRWMLAISKNDAKRFWKKKWKKYLFNQNIPPPLPSDSTIAILSSSAASHGFSVFYRKFLQFRSD